MAAEVTKTDLAAGLARGLVFVQANYAPSQEKALVDELIAEGKACGFWAFVDPGYTTGMVRLVRGRADCPKENPSRQWFDDHPGNWIWEYPSKPSRFLLHLCKYGPYTVYVGFLLRKLALERGLYPIPITPPFLSSLAPNIRYHGKKWRSKKKYFDIAVRYTFERVIKRLENPATPVEHYDHLVDNSLAWHGLAPLPTVHGEKDWKTYLPDW